MRGVLLCRNGALIVRSARSALSRQGAEPCQRISSNAKTCKRYFPSAMKKEMFDLSEALEFEKAAAIRDKIKELEEIQLAVSG